MVSPLEKRRLLLSRRGHLAEPIHFIGIGGSGMQPLAEYSLLAGKKIQGSDLKSHVGVERLAQQGVEIFAEHTGSNIEHASSVVYSAAVKTDNPEYQAALAKNIPRLHRAEYLAQLINYKKSVCVAGTHGKTTTAALITHMLVNLGLDPSAIIGGVMHDERRACRFGRSEYFVVEADESDGSLKYFTTPFIAVLTSIDSDHLDFYDSQNKLLDTFARFLDWVDEEDGCAVLNWDINQIRDIGHNLSRSKLTYGFLIGADVRAINVKALPESTEFRAVVERDTVDVSLPLIGKHNVENALCALAVARALRLNITNAAATLSTFKGVARRFDYLINQPELKLVDDYAHNPGKIGACLKAARQHWGDAQIIAIFEPHRYSRVRTMTEEFAGAFAAADLVIVTDVYSAGEAVDKNFDLSTFVALIAAQSKTTTCAAQDFEEIKNLVAQNIKKPAIIICVGAGDITTVAHKLKDEFLDGKIKWLSF